MGVGCGTAVVTERALSVVTGEPQSFPNWLVGSTAGGAVWGFVGTCKLRCVRGRADITLPPGGCCFTHAVDATPHRPSLTQALTPWRALPLVPCTAWAL